MDFKLHTIGFVLFLMMELPMSARSSGVVQTVMRKSLSSCVSGKWVNVGSFRFWQRVSCAKRRQAPGEELDELLPSVEAGPQRNATYNPTYGYEPYWADGEWVFDKKPDDKNDTAYMCGIRCPPIYADYGKVCARDKDFKYQTFENYCALKNFDCGGSQRWMMLYRGECYRDLQIYNRWYLHTRARLYISSFMEAHTLYRNYVGYVSKKPGEPFS